MFRIFLAAVGIVALLGCEEASNVPPVPPASALDEPEHLLAWRDPCQLVLDIMPEPTPEQFETWLAIEDADERAVTSTKERYALPLLLIYDSAGALIWNALGYNPESQETFADILIHPPSFDGPALAEVVAATDVAEGRPVDLRQAPDITFVAFAADWCAPCKTQSAAIRTFRESRPDLAVRHIEVDADLARMAGSSEPLICEGSLERS